MLIQNKILLAILAGVTSIGSFQVWQHNKQEYDKFIAITEQQCEMDFSSAKSYIYRSQTLRQLLYQNVGKSGIRKPGINSEFEKKSIYLLMIRKPTYLIPSSATYDSPFLKSLSKVGDTPPEPLLVRGVSINTSKKQAVVSSHCSKTPFTVNLEDLYETYQALDPDTSFGGADIFK
ncbi:hypothetical protein L6494_28380 (plasmid) [Nostoc sp. UHCC 0870]|nr:hypothetical protein [Nostoc sp. UHCC 0870]UKP01045.1 hypothetical protein L6494_28265 [Nostoc sp. UHCC 0870]UKP01228.1 hypothetical protein L6494_28380 [Nostoc sp. UHCC 0870]